MGRLNISLPDSLRSFVEEQAAEHGYRTSGEYVRAVIQKEQDRALLRGLLLDGAASDAGALADDDYFRSLRETLSDTRPD